MNNEINLVFTGDFCPIGRFEEKMASHPKEVMGEMFEVLQNADFCFTNLEAPITNHSKPITKTGPALKIKTNALTFLKVAGINHVTLANNHIMDYGEKGLIDTIEALKQHQISYVGAGMDFDAAIKPIFIQKNNIKIAVLNFAENEWSTTFDNAPGAAPIHAIKNFYAIKNARNNADYVIVVTHGGHEMNRYPSPRMKDLFRFYVDSGANAVINHHTHCTSGFEEYKEAPIFYSLGNFVFDHKIFRNNIWNKGMAVNLIFSNNQIKYEIVHFDQANDTAKVQICEANECEKRNQELHQMNMIIMDDEALQNKFQNWVNSQRKMYKSFIEPHGVRGLSILQSKKLAPSLWANRKKALLLNLIKCEAHQDVLVSILKDEISHT